MQDIKSFRDLIAWQKGLALVCEVYTITARLPDSERFGLVSQMRRCAVSVPSNIAEGQGRGTTSDFVRFLQIARGSVNELNTQAEVCIRLGYVGDYQQIITHSDEMGRILNGLISSLQSNQPRPTRNGSNRKQPSLTTGH